MKRNKQIDIKRALALSGIFNFLCSCSRSCLLPFLTLYFRQLGLSPAMTGVVMGTKHLIALVWSPVASLLSKRYNKRRVVITGSLVCSVLAALVLLLIPPTDVHSETSSCNQSDLSTSPTQSVDVVASSSSSARTQLKVHTTPKKGVTFSAEMSADSKSTPVLTSRTALFQQEPRLSQENTSAVVNGSAGEPKVSKSIMHRTTSSSSAPVRNKRFMLGSEEQPGDKTIEDETQERHFEFLGSLKVMDTQHQLFFLILIIVSVWESVSAPLEWTVDDGLYEYLDFADASDRYSSTRVWGLLGAACGVGGAGLLVSQLHCLIVDQTSRSAVHFYCYAALAALTLPVAAYLPLYLNKKRDRANGLLKAMQLVRGSPRALLCAITTLLVRAAVSAVDNFLLWQMQDHGSGKLHMGLSLALALLSEATFPCLLASRVSKLLSPGRVLALGAAILGLQCCYYSFLWGPWAPLPAQVLSCFSTGAFWWAVKVQCEDVATPGAERAVRRVYSAFCLHLGSALGSFAAGFTVQRFGLPWLFRGAAVGVTLWSACLLLLQWKAPQQRRINYSRLLAADASEASDSDSEQEKDWLEKAMESDRSNNNYGRKVNH